MCPQIACRRGYIITMVVFIVLFSTVGSQLSFVLDIVLLSSSHSFGVHCSLGSLAVHFKVILDRDTQIVRDEARYLHIKNVSGDFIKWKKERPQRCRRETTEKKSRV